MELMSFITNNLHESWFLLLTGQAVHSREILW